MRNPKGETLPNTESAGTGSAYQERIRNEIQHYSQWVESNKVAADVPRSLPEVDAYELGMEVYRPYLGLKMPHLALDAYVVDHQRDAQHALRLLSLGCGTGDWEVDVARRCEGRLNVRLVDLSADLLQNARKIGARDHLSIEIEACDVNRIEIEEEGYDFIICRSSLHHFVELEHVLGQVRRGLRGGGQFILLGEWVGRNGLRLYSDTETIAQRIFDFLPERLRLNNYTKEVDTVVPNVDHSVNSFEALRSEDILPLLNQHFTAIECVLYDAFLSLLLDFRYGPNYDISRPEDRAIVSLIAQMDIEFIKAEVLKPTALFGIYARG